MTNPERLRVLVADDNAHARAICLTALRRLGVGMAAEAADGAEAILKLLTGAPSDLMLLDWYMPDITGAGVMRVLRDPRFGPGAAMPVILMTAYPSHDNLARARALGVNDILPKPFTGAHLQEAMARVLAPASPGLVYV